jgi:DNA-binding transcriptional LysR family regulator
VQSLFSLRDLECFMAVVEHKTFSRAAKSLLLAQPPLSRRIAELERALGAHLFIRGARQAQLTHAGVALAREARIVLEQAKLAESIVRDAIQGKTGHVRVGYASQSAFAAVPPAAQLFRKLHPRATLKFVRFFIAHLNDALRSGAIDIGLINGWFEAEDFRADCLEIDRLVIALPENHPLAQQSVVAIADLADETFIEFPRFGPTGIHDLVRSVTARAGFIPKVSHEVEGHNVVTACVAAGLGIALVNEAACRQSIGGVVFREISPPSPEVRMTALSRHDEVNPLVLSFIEQLKVVCSDRQGTGKVQKTNGSRASSRPGA